MPDPLSQVRRAAAARRRADAAYRAAVLEAVRSLEAAGVSGPYAKVARAAGVSRQAVRELVNPKSRKAE